MKHGLTQIRSYLRFICANLWLPSGLGSDFGPWTWDLDRVLPRTTPAHPHRQPFKNIENNALTPPG